MVVCVRVCVYAICVCDAADDTNETVQMIAAIITINSYCVYADAFVCNYIHYIAISLNLGCIHIGCCNHGC